MATNRKSKPQLAEYKEQLDRYYADVQKHNEHVAAVIHQSILGIAALPRPPAVPMPLRSSGGGKPAVLQPQFIAVVYAVDPNDPVEVKNKKSGGG